MSQTPVRIPSEKQVSAARLTHYRKWLERQRGLSFADYEALWRWSVDDLAGFWSSCWEYFDILSDTPYDRVLGRSSMPGAAWFTGATLNYVDHVFRHATDDRPAIIFGGESRHRGEVSWRELQAQVASLAAQLRAMNVQPGDRVAAYLPNTPHAIISFLACASVGAVWSVCSPDMGPGSVMDRFRQIEPVVLIACDGTVYAGKRQERRRLVHELLDELKTVRNVIWVPLLDTENTPEFNVPTRLWADVVRDDVPLETIKVPFDHPLWILYSSGTTGLPKPIVHGQGGILLEHLKITALHNDIGPQDRFLWYSSTSWMMWNVQVAGLLTGATICIFDGSPSGSGTRSGHLTLWRFAAEHRVTFLGAGAAFYSSCMKVGINPARDLDLSQLRALGSTGSPLSPEVERWLYETIGNRVWVTPISGGTDVASAFVGGNPTLPTYLGEMQCRWLGARVEAWHEHGEATIGEVGELVLTAPMPSMPLYLWNDAHGSRYHESYFDMFPGVWRHGDWVRITDHSDARGVIIYGRSDATINRHGVRMGTAELYRVVEGFTEVIDSMVVDIEYLGRESYMPLFLVLKPGLVLDGALKSKINARIRQELSSRHVPNEIIEVDEIPRTLTGKKLELPIKRLLLGHALDKILNRDAMANPTCLDWYIEFSRRRMAAA